MPYSFKDNALLEFRFNRVAEIQTAIPKAFLGIINKRMEHNQEKPGRKNRTFGHPSLVAACTKDAMLKIESTNIHAEMVSGNGTKIDSIPAPTGPERRKLQRTGLLPQGKTVRRFDRRKGLLSYYFT